MANIAWIAVAVACLAAVSDSANILVISPLPTKSHYHVFDKLSVELAGRGHRVTIVSAFKQAKPVPNLEEIVLENMYEALIAKVVGEKQTKKTILDNQMTPWKTFFVLPEIGVMVSGNVLESPQFRNVLNSDRKFDLVISENFVFESVWSGLAHKFKAPVVIVAPFMANYWANFMVGNPAPVSYVSDPILGFSSPMTFFERLSNTVFNFLQALNYNLRHLPKQDSLMRKFFGEGLPPIEEIVKNTSLVLVNHHLSLQHPKPYVPNMIEIGGYHIPPPKPLPEDLKKFMDESKHGVILFSLGSHLKSSDMTQEMIDGVLAAFGRVKQNVLWKFEGDNLRNLPKNVKIMKWLPQTDLLAHPNLKLFVTHGGLLSTIEAAWNAMPLVGIPVLGDQPLNMKLCSNAGFAVKVDLNELNEQNLYNAIQEVLTKPKYAEAAKRISTVLRDRPMKPMDTAIYWIEYVIRHKGAPHLRSAAQDLRWYELYLLDVVSVILAAVAIAFYVVFAAMRLICRTICPASKKKNVPSAKKKN
ncbi:UNVERIFIED_CONTAM: hypothetical protein PYX00_007627 [Menopon gallinae]|uniref:UDP-glucuronosyltransferase n=1 Tax=Menopon gallinae TaxID=328185 RepID=A0AAW2HJI5_9NEOP